MTDLERIEALEADVKRLSRELVISEAKVEFYERPGSAALFYALNRKSNEIATLLNGIALSTVDMASKSDASFDRVFKLLEKSEVISTAAKSLGDVAGITGDEKKDVERKPFVDTIAEKRN